MRSDDPAELVRREAIRAYAELMHRIKDRLHEYNLIVKSEGGVIGRLIPFKIEYMALHTRKACEIILLAALCAVVPRNPKLRGRVRHFSRIGDLVSLVRGEYGDLIPLALGKPTKRSGHHHFEGLGSDTIDIALLERIHGIASTFLHERNPFHGAMTVDEAIKDISGFWKKTIKSLDNHMIRLAGTEEVIVCQMGRDPRARPHIVTAVQVPSLTRGVMWRVAK